MKTLLFALALLAVTGEAFSQTYRTPPQPGFWWNPNESGRGWTIETQNDITAVLHYVYDDQGRATFQQSAGIWDSANRLHVADLANFANGQCTGCPYRAPTASLTGTVRFEFDNETRGRVIYPNGTSIPIERFEYGYANAVEKLFGAWATSWTSASGIINTGHFIYFHSACPSTTCAQPTAQGTKKRSSSGRAVLMAPVSGIYLALIDASSGFYDYYFATVSTDRMVGLACSAPKTSPAPTILSCTGLMDGVRTYSLKHAQSVFGASKSSGLPLTNPEDDAVRLRGLAAEAALGAAVPADAEAVMALMLPYADELHEAAEALRQSF
jgi:hypothetical protein